MTKSTATRAKSRVVELDVEVDVLVDEADEDVAEALDVDDEVVGVLSKIMPLLVAAVSEADAVAERPLTTLVGLRGASLCRTCTMESTLTDLVDRPLNVTRAFSEEQLRLFAENKSSSAVPFSDTLKFVCAPSMRRGIELPTVTSEVPSMSVVVQPVLDFVVHVEPVYPFTHKQLQLPVLPMMLAPPFSQVKLF